MIIGAWNYPLQLVLIPLIGAICGGNCVIVKPSEISLEIGILLESLIKQYLDPNAIMVVNGDVSVTTRLLEKHFLVYGRMPSEPEMSLTINYIKKTYNIIVLSIILNSKHGNSSTRDKTLDIINKYNYGKKDMQKYDIDLLTNMKADIKNAGIIGKIRRRIGEKLENTVKSQSSSSSHLQNSGKHYNYSVIITDNTHYQLLKINKKVLSSYDNLSDFILHNDNSFSFSQTNISSIRSSSK